MLLACTGRSGSFLLCGGNTLGGTFWALVGFGSVFWLWFFGFGLFCVIVEVGFFVFDGFFVIVVGGFFVFDGFFVTVVGGFTGLGFDWALLDGIGLGDDCSDLFG